jgi:hypothetical protein
MNGLIPLYGADLELQDWVSRERAARLVSLNLVKATRSRTGQIKLRKFPTAAARSGVLVHVEWESAR